MFEPASALSESAVGQGTATIHTEASTATQADRWVSTSTSRASLDRWAAMCQALVRDGQVSGTDRPALLQRAYEIYRGHVVDARSQTVLPARSGLPAPTLEPERLPADMRWTPQGNFALRAHAQSSSRREVVERIRGQAHENGQMTRFTLSSDGLRHPDSPQDADRAYDELTAIAAGWIRSSGTASGAKVMQPGQGAVEHAVLYGACRPPQQEAAIAAALGARLSRPSHLIPLCTEPSGVPGVAFAQEHLNQRRGNHTLPATGHTDPAALLTSHGHNRSHVVVDAVMAHCANPDVPLTQNVTDALQRYGYDTQVPARIAQPPSEPATLTTAQEARRHEVALGVATYARLRSDVALPHAGQPTAGLASARSSSGLAPDALAVYAPDPLGMHPPH